MILSKAIWNMQSPIQCHTLWILSLFCNWYLVHSPEHSSSPFQRHAKTHFNSSCLEADKGAERILCRSDTDADLIIKPSLLLQPETNHTLDYFALFLNLAPSFFPVSQWCMQFSLLVLVCKFICSQNSSPNRLLLCLNCKMCTPACQLQELS